MKKRMSKSARETLEKMAKDPLLHQHGFMCPHCEAYAQKYAFNKPVIKWQDRTFEKVVYRVPKSAWLAIIFLFSGWITAMTGWITQKPIDKPYPVYILKHDGYPSAADYKEGVTWCPELGINNNKNGCWVPDYKFTECQADYRAQRATIKYLTKRQKETELP